MMTGIYTEGLSLPNQLALVRNYTHTIWNKLAMNHNDAAFYS